MPGFGVITGTWVRASEAAIAFSCVGVAVPERPPGLLLSLSVIVDVEGDREKVLVRGPRWVSFNFLVSFHDILGRKWQVVSRGCRMLQCQRSVDAGTRELAEVLGCERRESERNGNADVDVDVCE